MSEKATPSRFKQSVNAVLSSVTGYQLTRTGSERRGTSSRGSKRTVGEHKRVDRLVARPTFVIAPVRSGSSQLAGILNRHSRICAPAEVHLRFIHAEPEYDEAALVMEQMGIDQVELDYLLWDRILERELTASRKPVLVAKAPNIGFVWKRLREAWPAARYIFLIRHPATIAESMSRARQVSVNDVLKRLLDQGASINAARTALPGPTIRYEDLVADPAQVTKEVCAYLDLAWEPSMLADNGSSGGRFTMRFGPGHAPDVVLPTDDQVHPLLRDLSRSWGYLA